MKINTKGRVERENGREGDRTGKVRIRRFKGIDSNGREGKEENKGKEIE